ncbi:hypothetical protein DVH05_004312 [Phytophthora capsici]|nr:hypothetical protein DVH05_004312 [Phytophthora capsici]
MRDEDVEVALRVQLQWRPSTSNVDSGFSGRRVSSGASETPCLVEIELNLCHPSRSSIGVAAYIHTAALPSLVLQAADCLVAQSWGSHEMAITLSAMATDF